MGELKHILNGKEENNIINGNYKENNENLFNEDKNFYFKKNNLVLKMK